MTLGLSLSLAQETYTSSIQEIECGPEEQAGEIVIGASHRCSESRK